jgi:hypothetical protein
MISKIKQAILQTTGLEFQEYAVKSRELKYFFPRMIFSYKCHEHGVLKWKLKFILNKNWSTIHYSINRYPVEIETNPEFRAMVDTVNYYLWYNEQLNTPKNEFKGCKGNELLQVDTL